MNNVIGFPSSGAAQRQMRAEACAWLARLDAGATEADKQALHVWLERRPEHRQVLLDVAHQWDEMEILAELAEVFPLKQHDVPAYSNPRRIAAAAAVLFGISLGLYFMSPQQQGVNDQPSGDTAAVLRYETRIGEQSNITLSDGSRFILNTDSLVEVRYSQQERSIELRRGEGHFIVAKDVSRPFRVHAGNGMVEALGTAFAVQRDGDGNIEVTVTEGRVNVSRNTEAKASGVSRADSTEFVAGERALIRQSLVAIEKENVAPVDIEAELAWRNGMLLFQNDSLGEVLREFSRYTPIRIEADDEVLGTLVYAYLPAGDVDQLLTYLQGSLNLQVQHVSEGHIVLSAQ